MWREQTFCPMTRPAAERVRSHVCPVNPYPTLGASPPYALTPAQAAQPQVCDFGMSHVMEDAAEASDSRSVGSPQWTAPEKLRGGKYDEKADVFSFGAFTGLEPPIPDLPSFVDE